LGASAPVSKKALLTFSRNAQSMVSALTSPVGAAVVDQNVHPLLEGVFRPLDQPRRVGVLEVVGYEDSLPATSGYLFGHVAASLLVAARNDDPGPGVGETPGHLPPDPRGRTRHQRHAPSFYAHLLLLCLHSDRTVYTILPTGRFVNPAEQPGRG
jgi:hypothetical protein